jgi:hypothetical protein
MSQQDVGRQEQQPARKRRRKRPTPGAAAAPRLDLDDPDVAEYLVVREAATVAEDGDRAPMAVGLGLLPAAVGVTGRLYHCADRGARWLSLLFLSQGRHHGRDRDRYWLGVWRTDVRYGVARVGPPAEVEFAVGGPSEAVGIANRRLLRAAVDLHWAVLSVGFHVRRSWQTHLDDFIDLVADEGAEFRVGRRYRRWHETFCRRHGRPPGVEDKRANAYFYGGESAHDGSSLHHADWFPVPLMAFPVAARAALCAACTSRGDAGQQVGPAPAAPLPYAVVDCFVGQIAAAGDLPFVVPFVGRLEAVTRGPVGTLLTFRTERGEGRRLYASPRVVLDVAAGADVALGQRIGYEPIAVPLPPRWPDAAVPWRLRHLYQHLGMVSLERRVVEWFARQCLEVQPGFVHVPMVLGQFAARHSRPERLLWDLSPCMDYYEAEYDGFVFPPFNERVVGTTVFRVRSARVDLPVDLTPQRPPCDWHDRAKGDRRDEDAVGHDVIREVGEFLAAVRYDRKQKARRRREMRDRIDAAMERFRRQQKSAAVPAPEAHARAPVAPVMRIRPGARRRPGLRRDVWQGMPFHLAPAVLE